MTDETFQPDTPEEETHAPALEAAETVEAQAAQAAAAQAETPAEGEVPTRTVDLFDEDGESERFDAEGSEPVFADERAETADEGTGETPAAVSAPKKKGPIIAAVVAAVAVVAVAVILVCTLFAPKKTSPADAVMDYVEDVLPDNATDVAMETVGVPADATLLTVNGVDVSAEEYLYWLGYLASYYNTLNSYSGTEMDLTQEVREGVTWDQQLKGVARDNAVLLALTPGLAQELGVELTEEDLQSVVDDRAATLESLGQERYAYQLQAMGVSDATELKLDATLALYNKVQQAWTDKLAQDVTDETVDAYVEENDILRAKHILLMTVDPTTRQPLDEAAVAEKKAKAEDILAQLRADPSKFDELMQANSEDSGLAANPDGYIFTAGSMVEAFESGTRALEYDQISDLIESEYGYHIILRLDPDSDELRQDIAYEDFNDAIQARVDQAEVKESEAYAGITTAGYYEKLLDFQKTLTPPETDAGTGAEGEPQVVDQSRAELEPAS